METIFRQLPLDSRWFSPQRKLPYRLCLISWDCPFKDSARRCVDSERTVIETHLSSVMAQGVARRTPWLYCPLSVSTVSMTKRPADRILLCIQRGKEWRNFCCVIPRTDLSEQSEPSLILSNQAETKHNHSYHSVGRGFNPQPPPPIPDLQFHLLRGHTRRPRAKE